MKKKQFQEIQEENKYVIEVVDDKTVKIEISWSIDQTVLAILKNIDVIKWIIQILCEKTGAAYSPLIEKIVEEIRSPLKWKVVE